MPQAPAVKKVLAFSLGSSTEAHDLNLSGAFRALLLEVPQLMAHKTSKFARGLAFPAWQKRLEDDTQGVFGLTHQDLGPGSWGQWEPICHLRSCGPVAA